MPSGIYTDQLRSRTQYVKPTQIANSGNAAPNLNNKSVDSRFQTVRNASNFFPNGAAQPNAQLSGVFSSSPQSVTPTASGANAGPSGLNLAEGQFSESDNAVIEGIFARNPQLRAAFIKAAREGDMQGFIDSLASELQSTQLASPSTLPAASVDGIFVPQGGNK